MSFESLTNRGEYLSAHYLAEVLPTTLKGGLLKRWAEEEKAGRLTPRAGLRGMRRDYFDARAELAADPDLFDPERLRKLHDEILRRLGFEPAPQTITVERAGQEHEIRVAHAEVGTGHGIVALDCGWAVDTDAAQDPDGAGKLLDPPTLATGETITAGQKLASWLFAADTPKIRYALILAGGVVTLADRSVWGEGRYLAVSLDTAYARNEDRELDVIAALFGADSLRPPAEGGSEPLADLLAGSRQHAVGVSGELRQGLRESVELIANEVLDRIRQAGHQPQQVMELDELAKELGREALRYLYRILFLLYAEARPELGVLPVDDPEYVDGYSLARLGDLVARRLPASAEDGFHLYESLDLLFDMVNRGHRPRAGQAVEQDASEDVGLRFEPLRSDLFLPEKTRLIGWQLPVPGSDPDDPAAPKLDTRLRNVTLYQVLRRLMLTKGSGRKRRGGFISYAQLGINQLGAVYEGLMSYTGFVATERLYEVAKHGDPKDGSWMIPASKAEEYDDGVFVYRENLYTGVRSRVSYDPGQFVYRLAGRDRQTSASYYTPQSLTEVTVQLALKYRLDQDGTTTRARELLDWTICEPALGSGAFLNEAINQVAAEYLRRRQAELKVNLDPETYHLELQRVKAYIALHNCYGVDLNRTAVELAEVSVWLNVMHAGLQAPWFGLHLRRGNSLIGGARKLYAPKQLADKSWLTTAPQEKPFRDGPIDPGTIHHFLLPADGWGAVAGEKEARELAPAETEKLKKWRTAMKRVPNAKGSKQKPSQVARLQALAGRVEFLWELVGRRLAISEREIRRHIPVWGADDLPPVTEAVPREKILADLTAPGTPYWRLKTLMDTWCALWFWPLDKVAVLDGSDPAYANSVQVSRVEDEPEFVEQAMVEQADLFGNVTSQQLKLPTWTGSRKATANETLRQQVPLTSLDDWITFAESLIGRRDVVTDDLAAIYADLTTLPQMTAYETKLDGLIGVDQPWALAERFPWLHAAEELAEQQGFFHWELTFAQAFANGGFDIQVGNPPWVRPTWKLDSVLAEVDPWFALAEKPRSEVVRDRKNMILSKDRQLYFALELARHVGLMNIVSSLSEYPLLVGTQPDLYRSFMCRVWANSAPRGCAGMIHPDTHLVGAREGSLRGQAYRRLRLHAHFRNERKIFPDVHNNTDFGVHIYGKERDVDFGHLSYLHDPSTLVQSLEHDGSGPLPGIKYRGAWDVRPHRSRVVRIVDSLLEEWHRLAPDRGLPPAQSPILYPISVHERDAISALSGFPHRMKSLRPRASAGFHEKMAKDKGLIRWSTSRVESLGEVILQGPHVGIATSFSKEPKDPCKSNNDWLPTDLRGMSSDFVPTSNYVRDCARDEFLRAQDSWGDRKSTEYYRLAWRVMVPFDTERSLFSAILPPGPAHTHGLLSCALSTNIETLLASGFWAALPVDYLLRITSKANLHVSDAFSMPVGNPSHPLAQPLLLRVLRLNCVTSAYSGLWSEVFSEEWESEDWVFDWPRVQKLARMGFGWNTESPLRTEFERRAALVEIDALVAVWLGIGVDELIAILRSRYPILSAREERMWFDRFGRKIAQSPYVFGYGQTKFHYESLMAHLDDPERNPVPEGYVAPFYKADRESEYRKAHAVFSKRLQDAVDVGWGAS
ncbi:class I SAM-dependent DNA methyltransferase [Solwaraspora sp. WMMD1047]|uniref:class I SAM-dependent DNA methyltransferase n=1 Tax=Solwaraspora sp. WMMD1047 TaxID=3016102 RepID=UPI0024176946|nr:class I SAM-dependent DNA methyltransferase [Solwaraspora sp. WMMD1047]MDG4830460.1 class I SAM-dependent DNA methyltransferase [Solwaraspora sp. WMMD1047]